MNLASLSGQTAISMYAYVCVCVCVCVCVGWVGVHYYTHKKSDENDSMMGAAVDLCTQDRIKQNLA